MHLHHVCNYLSIYISVLVFCKYVSLCMCIYLSVIYVVVACVASSMTYVHV